jgi:hypothetical protein
VKTAIYFILALSGLCLILSLQSCGKAPVPVKIPSACTDVVGAYEQQYGTPIAIIPSGANSVLVTWSDKAAVFQQYTPISCGAKEQ